MATASTSSSPSTAPTAGPAPTTASRAKGFLRAIDYQTGKIVWEHPYPRGSSSAGVLTTDTGLTITGDGTGNLLALRSSDGNVVWHENIGRMGGAPATFELDGKQYLLVTGGNSLFAYALP